jgi:hypothetical protein
MTHEEALYICDVLYACSLQINDPSIAKALQIMKKDRPKPDLKNHKMEDYYEVRLVKVDFEDNVAEILIPDGFIAKFGVYKMEIL